MQAVRVHSYGGPEVLRLEGGLTPPEPGPDQARVRVEAAGVNFIDIYQRSGAYSGSLPFTPGMEAAGVVDAVGPGVEGLAAGQRVGWAMYPGAYASLAVVPADRLVPLPPGIDAQQAAAVLLQGMTAHYLTHATFPLHAGHTCLVHAAAGGVGLLLCQMAKMRGARVLGTVSTEAKAALAREAGADEVIRYDQQDFLPEVRRHTDGLGVDVVYDSVGRDTFDRSLGCLVPRGYLVLFGQSSGPVPAFDPQVLNARGSLFLTRPSLGHYVADRPELLQRAGDVLGWVASGQLTVRVEEAYPLADAARAHADLASRRTSGKLVLSISGAAAP